MAKSSSTIHSQVCYQATNTTPAADVVNKRNYYSQKCKNIVCFEVLVPSNSSDTTKNSGIGIGEYLNPHSDPIPWSYTRPIVMPASFASCCKSEINSSSVLRMQTQEVVLCCHKQPLFRQWWSVTKYNYFVTVLKYIFQVSVLYWSSFILSNFYFYFTTFQSIRSYFLLHYIS